MDDHFIVECPYCGEQLEIYVEPDVRGTFVQDCEVCCNPWRVRVIAEGDDRYLDVARADGSESSSLHAPLSMGTVLGEMLTPKDGHRDELSQALLIIPPYEATVSSVLPNRKAGTGGSPSVHHFRIWPRSGSDPFEQIEYQDFYRIRQRGLSSSAY
jgi:hypothetical protein